VSDLELTLGESQAPHDQTLLPIGRYLIAGDSEKHAETRTCGALAGKICVKGKELGSRLYQEFSLREVPVTLNVTGPLPGARDARQPRTRTR
jgi:hypothetical protein